MRLEDEKAEADRLAAIQAEKDKADREERIKQDAIIAEQAKQKAAQEKAEADKLAAEKMAELAIENARLEKLAAEQAAIKLAEQVEANRLKAIADAKVANDLAIENERKRIEAEQAKQKAIDDKKAADFNHRKTVNNAIRTELVKNGFSDEDAIKIIKLAANNLLASLIIAY